MTASARRSVVPLAYLMRTLPALVCVSACVHQGSRPGTVPATPPVPAQAAAPAGAPASPSQPSASPPAATPGNAAAATQALPPQSSAAANARSPSTAPKSPASNPRSTSPRPAQPSPPQPAVAAAPALDLKALEQRLRDTSAIGVFTKLTLKNQVDDLLAQFKAFHQGHSQVTLAQLRQKYEELLLKVVSLLQDGDPALASAISASREAIWNVLTDPKKFANI